MCNRYTLRTQAAEIAKYFDASLPRESQLSLRFSIKPTNSVAVVRATPAGRELSMMRWGLIPSWSKDIKTGFATFNARSETAAEKPAFRSAMKSRHCLIPASGYFEWKTEGKKKQPYRIRLKSDELFAFAGLWEKWQDIESCTIMTTSPNEELATIHDRMPVILSPSDYNTWLDPTNTDIKHLFEPYPASEMTYYPDDPNADESIPTESATKKDKNEQQDFLPGF